MTDTKHCNTQCKTKDGKDTKEHKADNITLPFGDTYHVEIDVYSKSPQLSTIIVGHHRFVCRRLDFDFDSNVQRKCMFMSYDYNNAMEKYRAAIKAKKRNLALSLAAQRWWFSVCPDDGMSSYVKKLNNEFMTKREQEHFQDDMKFLELSNVLQLGVTKDGIVTLPLEIVQQLRQLNTIKRVFTEKAFSIWANDPSNAVMDLDQCCIAGHDDDPATIELDQGFDKLIKDKTLKSEARANLILELFDELIEIHAKQEQYANLIYYISSTEYIMKLFTACKSVFKGISKELHTSMSSFTPYTDAVKDSMKRIITDHWIHTFTHCQVPKAGPIQHQAHVKYYLLGKYDLLFEAKML